MSRCMRAPQWFTGNAVISISPAALLTLLLWPHSSSVTSENWVPFNKSLVARAVIIFVEALKRSQIEVIKMRMRKKNEIDLRQLIKAKRRRSQSFGTDGESRQTDSYAGKKHGIGENDDAEKI